MIKIKGLSPRTVEGYRWSISFFLKWLNNECHGNLNALCLNDVDAFSITCENVTVRQLRSRRTARP